MSICWHMELISSHLISLRCCLALGIAPGQSRPWFSSCASLEFASILNLHGPKAGWALATEHMFRTAQFAKTSAFTPLMTMFLLLGSDLGTSPSGRWEMLHQGLSPLFCGWKWATPFRCCHCYSVNSHLSVPGPSTGSSDLICCSKLRSSSCLLTNNLGQSGSV